MFSFCFLFFSIILLLFFWFFIIEIFIILLLVNRRLGIFLGLLFLLLILFVLHLLLCFFGDSPQLLSHLLCVLDIIGNENAVEDCAGLDLPQIEPELAVL